jgi:hypothetical protein
MFLFSKNEFGVTRFWGAPSKCEFLKDGMNIVDVLAILPYFVSAIVLGLREAEECHFSVSGVGIHSSFFEDFILDLCSCYYQSCLYIRFTG